MTSLAAVLVPSTYTSRALIHVADVPVVEGFAGPLLQQDGARALHLIESRLMTRSNLISIAKNSGVPTKDATMGPDQIVAYMRANTTITLSKGQNSAALMSLEFRARDPQIASKIVNGYIEALTRNDGEEWTRTALTIHTFLVSNVQRLTAKVAQQDARMSKFQSDHIDTLPDNLPIARETLVRKQNELVRLGQELDKLNSRKSALINQVKAGNFGGSNVKAARTELYLREQDLNHASSVFSLSNPKVNLLRAQATAAKDSYERALRDDPARTMLMDEIDEVSSLMDASVRAQNKVRIEISGLEKTIQGGPATAFTLAGLEASHRDLQTQLARAKDALVRAEASTSLERDSGRQRIKVIDPPVASTVPVGPNRPATVLGGGLIGLIAGATAVLILERADRTIRRSQDLVNDLGLTPFATIPLMVAHARPTPINRVMY